MTRPSGPDTRPPEPLTRPPAEAPRGLLGVGAAGLGIEAVVVLLAAPAVVSLDRGHVSGIGVGFVLAVAVLLVLAAARLRRPGGKVFASALQVLVVVTGVVTWPMYVVGAIFAGIWLWWLLQWPRRPEPPG